MKEEKTGRTIAAYIPARARILDLGCGSGSNLGTILAHDPGCRITGMDLSQGLLALAREKYPQVRFLHQDIRFFPTGSRYQVVIASFSIVHLNGDETRRLLARIAEVLVEGGALYLSFMEGEGAGFETTSFSEEEIYFNFYRSAELTALLQGHGLEVREILRNGYEETDGSVTTDVFLFACKTGAGQQS